MFFLVLNYDISTTVLQILVSLRSSVHPFKGGHWCSTKRLFELSEAFIIWCFEKNNWSKNSCILCVLSRKTFRMNFYLGTLAGLPRIFPKSSLEQLFCREPVSDYFWKKKTLQHTLISGISQNFKIMQGKARGCNLKIGNLLKGTP